MKKNNHIYQYLVLLLITFSIYVMTVNAEIYRFNEECGNSNYQCIACEYEATNVNKNQHVVFYAKSNGDGTVNLSNVTFSVLNGKKSFSNVITWSISSEGSKFISSDGNKLVCPPVYMKHDGAGNTEKISVHIGNDNITQSTMIENADNGKAFLKNGTRLQDTSCPNIPIYIIGISGVNTRNYKETNETGTIIKGDNPHLELPANYKDNTKWTDFTDFSHIDNCDEKIIIACSEQTIQSYQSAYVERTCFLTSTDELNGRVKIETQQQEKDDKSSSNTPEKVVPGDNFDVTPLSVCASSSFRKPMRFVGWVIRTLKYLIPLIIIGFGVLDLYRSMTNQDAEKSAKTALKGFAVRVLAGVVIFLLPGIIEFILGMVSTWNSGNKDYNYSTSWSCCAECAFDADCDVTGNITKYCK